MKAIYFVVLLSLNLIANDRVIEFKEPIISEKPQVLLNSISPYAIKIGTGHINKVYIFVDPMCKYSKKIIKKIVKNKMLQAINSYYIFLYRLPKFESDELIQYIYQSTDIKNTLIDVMVKEKGIDLDYFEISDNKIKMIEDIASVGKKLKMKKRPYMMVFEKDSKYCRVSEGSASCMEEFDFE